MDKHCIHSIETKPPLDSEKIMSTEQPNTIAIDGVELPTMKKVFAIQRELDRQTRKLNIAFAAVCVLAAAVIILGLKGY